jgi:hypothetical protein
VDFKEGVIGVPGASARSLRIYYQADGDWALHVFKPFDIYRQSYQMPPSEREYYVGAWGDQDERGKVFFRRCYSGFSVALDMRYTVEYGNGNTEVRTVYGDTYQISKQYLNAGGTSNPAYVCWIDPLARLSRAVPAGATIRNIEVVKAYGVSVGAKVIWREGGSGTRVGRWKVQELQSCMVRSAND